MLVSSYYKSERISEELRILKSEDYVPITSFFFTLSRNWDWGKSLRWYLQEEFIDTPGNTSFISRNNAMRPDILFTEYDSSSDTDILQEYFIPTYNITAYLSDVKNIVKKYNVNLLSATIRYVPKNTESFLSYSNNDLFSVVLYINQELTANGRKNAETWTRELVDMSHNYGGLYYLPYQLYPTKEQLVRAYPNFGKFIKFKRKYDPDNRFMNMFYQFYGGND